MTDEDLDFKWGLPVGTVASWGLKPPPDVAEIINRQLDREIAARLAIRRNARADRTTPQPHPRPTQPESQMTNSQLSKDVNAWLGHRSTPQPQPPADGEVAKALKNLLSAIEGWEVEPQPDDPLAIAMDQARAILTRPHPPADGEVVEPSDEDLLRVYGRTKRGHCYCYEGPPDDWPKRAERAATIAGLRAVLARWGTATPQPPADGVVGE